VLQARVQHLERLGESSLLYLVLAAGEGTANQGTVDTGAAGVTGAGVTGAGRVGMAHAPLLPLTVRVEGHAEATVGDAVVVSVRAGALHLFDSDGQACRRTVVLPH
jgi:ABC-type sugar transport system ATPase subunit